MLTEDEQKLLKIYGVQSEEQTDDEGWSISTGSEDEGYYDEEPAKPVKKSRGLIVGVNDLATVNPKLTEEWDYEKNEGTPQDYTGGSHYKAYWVCSNCGYKWDTPIKSRHINGRGCKICAKQKQVNNFVATKVAQSGSLADTAPYLLEEWDYIENNNRGLDPMKITANCSKLAHWVCKVCKHPWDATVNTRYSQNTGCPVCANKALMHGYNDLASKYPDIAEDWDIEANYPLTPMDIVYGSHEKVHWVCKICGHHWDTAVSERTSHGRGCPECGKIKQGISKRRNLILKIGSLADTNPELAEEWHPIKNADLTPNDVTAGSETIAWWKCRVCGHEWEKRIASRNSGLGCPACANRAVNKGVNDLATKRPDLAVEFNNGENGITASEVVYSTSNKYNWKCSVCGHVWSTSCEKRVSGTGCPVCSGSYGEKALYSLLDVKRVPFEYQKKFNNIQVSFFPFDFYVPSSRVVIEIDGEQHFRERTGWGSLERVCKKDNLKSKFCLAYNYYLLRIPYIRNVNFEDYLARCVLSFLETRIVPDSIIEIYAQHEFSNYAEIARKQNERVLAEKSC